MNGLMNDGLSGSILARYDLVLGILAPRTYGSTAIQ